MKHGKHIIIPLILLLTSVWLQAQVKVRSTIDRDSILIGEPISLTVEAYMPLGSKISWFNSDTIPHFQITNRSPVDTAENIDGKKLSQTLTITSFDSGRWQMPAFEVMVDNDAYYTDTLSIAVGFTPFDRNADYRDISDIIDIQNPAAGNIPWYVAALAVLSLAVLIYFLRKRKTDVPVKKIIVPVLSPYEEAMQALSALRKRRYTEADSKLYYTDMNDILRNYVLRQFGIATFERTNEELIMQLSRLHISRDVFIRLSQALRMSDFVKFAKYVPGEKENEANLDIVITSIEAMDKKELSAV